jgi:glycosyltransferase involved in cell wall biosynthesis
MEMIGTGFWEYYPPTLVESINWLPSTQLFKAINAVNNKRFAKDIRNAVAQLGFKDYILFNDNDIFNGYHMKQLLHPALYVYYCRDYIRGNTYWGKHGGALEPDLIRSADLAVANSLYLTEYCAAFNKNSHYIGQGCDLQLFDSEKSLDIPPEMKSVRRPVIGYVGAIIASRLDQQIIRLIAEANPQWSVVLVGPEDDVFKKSMLHDLPNVLFTGRREMKDLPGFVQCFDVCINPQLVNALTIGNYPLKVDEYLAMGKPVVATRTKTMELFEDYTYLAGSPEEYPGLVEKALQENNEILNQKRIAFARSHTWENSVNELMLRIRETESRKKEKVLI